MWQLDRHSYIPPFEAWLVGLWCLYHIQQYFSYIMAASFIGGENNRLATSY
jgi:hypothetical protein